MNRSHAPHPARIVAGYTLIELMLTVAILGVALSIAAPLLQDTVRNQRVRAAATSVMSTFMVARSEAQRFGVEVSIVAPGNDFNRGWCVVFGSAAECDLADPDNNVMRVQTPLAGVIMPSGAAGARVVLSRTGRLAAPVSVTIVNDGGPVVARRCVDVAASGSVTVRAC